MVGHAQSQELWPVRDILSPLGPLPDSPPIPATDSPAVEWVKWASQSLFDCSHLQGAILRRPKLVFLICLG